VASPGGAAFMIVTSVTAYKSRGASDITFCLTNDAPAKDEAAEHEATSLMTVEMLGFLCNLFSSMYNALDEKNIFPYWTTLFQGLGRLLGFTSSAEQLTRAMYTMGLPVNIPPSVPLVITTGVSGVEPVYSLVFLLSWCILPMLYVTYFWCMHAMAMGPGIFLQRTLAVWGIIHFLFITDGVDYAFGRGYQNPFSEQPCHKSEIYLWRWAILLPIYQKVMADGWRKYLPGYPRCGSLLHYGLIAWAIVFFIYMVCLHDFVSWGLSDVKTWKLYDILGYNNALTCMFFLYFLLWAFSSTHVHIVAVASTPGSSIEEGQQCMPGGNLLVSCFLTAVVLFLLTSVKAMNQ